MKKNKKTTKTIIFELGLEKKLVTEVRKLKKEIISKVIENNFESIIRYLNTNGYNIANEEKLKKSFEIQLNRFYNEGVTAYKKYIDGLTPSEVQKAPEKTFRSYCRPSKNDYGFHEGGAVGLSGSNGGPIGKLEKISDGEYSNLRLLK